MRPLLSALALLVPALLASPALARSPLEALHLEVEAGPAAVLRNDNRFGATGTLFTARDVNQHRTLFPTHRLSGEARLGERHGLLFLYAPLDLRTRATLGRDLDFHGVLFREGSTVDSRYVFDGYRASYLLRVVAAEDLEWDLGASLQVRSALVELRTLGGNRYAFESDIGLVPAVKTRLRTYFSSRLWAALEVDLLSTLGLVRGTTGGLYDVALTLGAPLGHRGDDAAAFLRLRLYGGGAEVRSRALENWGTFGFALVGLRADLVALVERGLRL